MKSEGGEGNSGRSREPRRSSDGRKRGARARRKAVDSQLELATIEPSFATPDIESNVASMKPRRRRSPSRRSPTGGHPRRRTPSPRTPTDRQLLAALAPVTYDESGFRTDTHSVGQGGETRATALLAREGYTIVERNYRCSLGELDIVAREGDVLAFVEVRSRTDDSHGHAAEMVTPDKQHKVTRVAECYLLDREPPDQRMRFDVVAITGDAIDLIKDAWRL